MGRPPPSDTREGISKRFIDFKQKHIAVGGQWVLELCDEEEDKLREVYDFPEVGLYIDAEDYDVASDVCSYFHRNFDKHQIQAETLYAGTCLFLTNGLRSQPLKPPDTSTARNSGCSVVAFIIALIAGASLFLRLS